MEAPQKFDPLLAYMQYVLAQPLTQLLIPTHAVSESEAGKTGKSHTLILDRQGQFQTQLYIFPADVKALREHTHPDVNSYAYFLNGDFSLVVEGVTFDKSTKRIFAPIPAEAKHSASFRTPSALLSFQHWLTSPPTSISDKFEEVTA
jgi:hypothetical protein